MKDAETLARAGADFGKARRDHNRRANVPVELLPADEEEAYVVQDAAIEWMSANGLGPPVGYKVANVSVDMKKQLATIGSFGIDTPIYGPIMSGFIYHELAEIDPYDNQWTFIECEFGIRIGQDAPPEGAPYTRDSIADHIEACMAGIEIAAATLEKNDYGVANGIIGIADNGSNRGAIFGPPVTDWQKLDIPLLTARVSKNGKEYLTGEAKALLGHPFEVAAWLANRLIDHGKHLRQGQHVLLGSIGRGINGDEFELISGDEIVAEWDELGAARIRIN